MKIAGRHLRVAGKTDLDVLSSRRPGSSGGMQVSVAFPAISAI